MKKILDGIPKSTDEVLASFATGAAEASNFLRWFFFAMFAIASIRSINDDGWLLYVYPLMSLLWMAAAFLTRPGNFRAAAHGGQFLLLDLSIISIGLWICAFNQALNTKGTILFICFFPVIAIAARNLSAFLVIRGGVFAFVMYLVLAMVAMSTFPVTKLLSLIAITIAAVSLSRKPRQQIIDFGSGLVKEAYQLGSEDTRTTIVSKLRASTFPPVQYDLPGLYATYKHGVGRLSSGDLYVAASGVRGPVVFLGDFSGAGLESSLDASKLNEILRQEVAADAPLAEIAKSLNSRFLKEKRVATAFLARWEGAELSYLNAGHLPGVNIVKRETHALNANGPAFGAEVDPIFAAESIPCGTGDMLLLYTDGAYSGLASTREAGAAEVLRLVHEFNGGEVNTICHRVFDCGQPEFQRSGDDSTVVVIRRQEAAASA